MWRWPVVQWKKDLSNAAKQKVFSLHAKLIALAATNWSDPELNPALSDAIEKAKKDNVPNDNIERAIKKWAWLDKSSEQVSQIIYEWYAPGWVAVIIQTLTDNKNRTASNIRHIFSKFWWNMWESGSVAWIFERKWVIYLDKNKIDFEKLEEFVFETEAENIIVNNDEIQIICHLDNLKNLWNQLMEKWFKYTDSKLEYIASNEIEISEFDKALKIIKMIEALEEDEDIEDYSINAIINDDLKKEVIDFIEKNTFKT